ncbi:MAG: hypothetical protein R6V03_03540 [Kiritimatiellia bacterium]
MTLSTWLIAAVLFTGCEDDDDSTGVPDVSGSWSGYYYIQEEDSGQIHYVESLSAEVTQSGTNLTILTSRPEDGRELTGTIDTNGEMILVDAYDLEIWSTYYLPATETYLQVNDIVFADETGHPEWGMTLATIELER